MPSYYQGLWIQLFSQGDNGQTNCLYLLCSAIFHCAFGKSLAQFEPDFGRRLQSRYILDSGEAVLIHQITKFGTTISYSKVYFCALSGTHF